MLPVGPGKGPLQHPGAPLGAELEVTPGLPLLPDEPGKEPGYDPEYIP